MLKEKTYFRNYLKGKRMRCTKQRNLILDYFLKNEGHKCADEIFLNLHKTNQELGASTVYRTVKLLKEAALAREVNFTGRRRRFEHEYDHPHHDHLICLKCGKTQEFCEPDIEELQNNIVKKYGFVPKNHKMEIYGYCRKCKLQITNDK